VRLDDVGQGRVQADYDRSAGRLSRGLAVLALPLAPNAQHRWHALLNPLVAYAAVFLSLVIVHIPIMLTGARSFTHAAEIFWGDLVSSHLGHLVLYGALIALLSYAEGLLGGNGGKSWDEYILTAVKIVFWASLVVGVGLRLSGSTIGTMTLLTLALVIVAELTGVGALSTARTGDVDTRSKNVLIVGTTATAARVAKSLSTAANGGRVVKGILTRSHRNRAVHGTVDELAHLARAEFIDEVIVACGDDRELAERAVAEAVRNHLDVSIVPDFLIDWPSSVSIQTVSGIPLISVHEEPIPWVGLVLKRIMDVALSAIALVFFLPLMAIIALAIKLESRGPVLYSALRVGKKGRTFKCYKFRTMRPDADRAKELLRALNQRHGPTFKIVNDPRITPLGRILRRYSLDELPQLWNVLTGSMSLVGPRPHPVDDYGRYSLEDRRRLDVAPGITGLWQVTARTDPSFRTNMALDLEYIENWSLGMDLAIVLKTLPAVWCGTGA
jgi:exopolysaccharide biosynthesis polyprenyl glycosylphosphotransferase